MGFHRLFPVRTENTILPEIAGLLGLGLLVLIQVKWNTACKFTGRIPTHWFKANRFKCVGRQRARFLQSHLWPYRQHPVVAMQQNASPR